MMWQDGWYGYHMGWWGAGVMGVLVLCAIIVFAMSGSDNEPPGAEPALDILKRRFASGEITEAEFNQMRDELRA